MDETKKVVAIRNEWPEPRRPFFLRDWQNQDPYPLADVTGEHDTSKKKPDSDLQWCVTGFMAYVGALAMVVIVHYVWMWLHGAHR